MPRPGHGCESGCCRWSPGSGGLHDAVLAGVHAAGAHPGIAVASLQTVVAIEQLDVRGNCLWHCRGRCLGNRCVQTVIGQGMGNGAAAH